MSSGDFVKRVLCSLLHRDLSGATQSHHASASSDDLTLAMVPNAKGQFFRIRWRRVDKPTKYERRRVCARAGTRVVR